MEETYAVRCQLEKLVEKAVNNSTLDYVHSQEKRLEWFLQYPLINIELGATQEEPESLENAVRRDRFAFLVQQTIDIRKGLNYSSEIKCAEFEEFKNEKYKLLGEIYTDYCTLLEIQDSTSFAKSRVEKKAENLYQFTTSLVSDKYREEDFYFNGFDDPEEFEAHRKFMQENITKIATQYFVHEPQKLKRLFIDVDMEIFEYSKKQIERDLSKLPNKIKSEIFSSRQCLVNVLGFLYYMGMVRKLLFSAIDVNRNLDKCIIDVDKMWLINKINKITGESTEQVSKIINYLINDGQPHILEFPLFEHAGHIITVPSLLMVNDWQFSLVGGHYYKNIDFLKRDKTISKSTQEKLKTLLKAANNIVFCEEKCYEFKKNGAVINSDIDFAVFDKVSNNMLVIEAKWKDNHYQFTQEKRYKKIEDTCSKAYKEQISKHQEYLETLDNPLRIFEEYDGVANEELPSPIVYFLAVDKRNQLHLEDKHMISEFMLLAFLQKARTKEGLNLYKAIENIFKLQTKVEYISIAPQKHIKLNDVQTVVVDACDFLLDYDS